MELYSEQLRIISQNIQDPKRLLFIVGAGVSVSAGYPLWASATKTALDLATDKGLSAGARAYAQEKLGKGNYYGVFDVLHEELTEPAFYEIAGRVFAGSNEASDLHRLLLRIKCRGIITTNFDECLATACVQERGSPPINSSEHAIATDAFFIVKPHGTILDPRTMVLTTSAWRKLANDTHFKSLLGYAVSMCQVLFVGYSLRDPDFNQIWTELLAERVFRAPGLYCCPKGSTDGARQEEFRSRNVQLVEFEDDGSFSFVPRILESLVERVAVSSAELSLASLKRSAQELEKFVFLYMQFSPNQKERLVLVCKAVALETFALQGGTSGITEEDVFNRIRTTLGQDSATLGNAVHVALHELADEKILSLTGKSIQFDKDKIQEITKLVDGLHKNEQRWAERVLDAEGKSLSTIPDKSDRDQLLAVFDQVLLEMGRRVAELLLFNRHPGTELSRADRVVDTWCTENRLQEKRELYQKVIRKMLFEPNGAEEDILFQKLQAYFIASAYVLDPTSEKLLTEYARDHWVYLDSSIILPALAIGHPSHGVYDKMLRKTLKLGMQLRVTEDMIDEVWANVGIATAAFAEFSASGAGLKDTLEGYVTLHGRGSGNVFLEGFLNQLRLDDSLTPGSYLSGIFRVPKNRYSKADILAALIDTFGIERDVLRQDEVEPNRLDPIITSIEYLRKLGGRFRTKLLCEHEAKQFYLIHHRRQQNPHFSTKIWFLTTDYYITELERTERERYPLPISYTPRRWFQYLDLVDFDSRGSRHFGRLQSKMRFGVVSSGLGIEGIRTILAEQKELLAKGVVTVKELADVAVRDYHVRQSIAEYDRKAGSPVAEETQKAKMKIREQIGKAVNQFVAVRVQEIEQLRKDKESVETELTKTRKRLAKEQYVLRNLKSQRSPVKKKKTKWRKH